MGAEYYDKRDNKWKMRTETQITQKYEEYRINSTDPFPQAKANEKGSTLLIMDTGELYFNRGGTWGLS